MEYELILIFGISMVICFVAFIKMASKMASAFSPSNGEFIKMIGFVFTIVMVVTVGASVYDEYKYETASVEKVNNVEIIDKKTTDNGYETIVKYRGKKYKSIDKDLYKNVKIGEKMKGHVVEGTNKLHDVDGYAVEKD